MHRIAVAVLAVTCFAFPGCQSDWSTSTGQPGFSDGASRVEPIAGRIDTGSWMRSRDTEVWRVLESQMGRPERHIGYATATRYRQNRGGPEYGLYKITSLKRDDQIGHITPLGRAVRYAPKRNGSFDEVSLGSNTLELSIAEIFGTTRPIRLDKTSERQLAFNSIDRNGDGLLQPAESAEVSGRIQEADTNGDGGVDFEEFDVVDAL